MKPAILAITFTSWGLLLTGLAVLFFGSSDAITRIPATGLIAAAVIALAGTIYLHVKRKVSNRPAQSLASTLVFALLVVVAVILSGYFLTHH